MSDAPMGAVADDDPRRRLAAALRPIITLTVAATFDDEVLAMAAERLEEVGRTLASAAGPKRARQQPNISQHAQEFFPTSPIMGMANPIAPPVVVHVVDGVDGGYPEIRAEAWFDWAYEGPPTCVHGGVIAETFDEMLGAANMVAGNPGMTGSLTVRYRKPTPLRTPLRIEARCLSRDGRKIKTWAGMYHGDLLTAEADGLFIEVNPSQFLAIAEGNVDNADPAVLEAMRAEAVRVGAASDVQLAGPVPDPEPPTT
ncbi:MAG TPA: PaaI family thioesterase [Acidimicrobiales bacterium]